MTLQEKLPPPPVSIPPPSKLERRRASLHYMREALEAMSTSMMRDIAELKAKAGVQ